MVQNQRIPIGVMLVGFIVGIPLSAFTALKNDVSYDTPAGRVFSLSLSEMDQHRGRVASDMAIAYQARCRGPIKLATLKTRVNSKQGEDAIAILRESCQSVRECSNEPGSIGLKTHEHYLRLVTTQQCES